MTLYMPEKDTIYTKFIPNKLFTFFLLLKA